MAEEHARWKQYEYAANSNLVLTSDRRGRDNEPSGEAESLANKKLTRMGDRVMHSKPTALTDKKDKIEKRRAERASKESAKKKARFSGSVLSHDVVEPGSYRPKTEPTRQAYEQLLNFLSSFIGDQANDILRGAADEVLAVIKDDAVVGQAKQKACEQLLSSMTADKFSSLMQICGRITDFAAATQESLAGEGMDENIGVSVVFDEEEASEDEDLDEIKDEEDDEEGDDGEAHRTVIGLKDEDGGDMPDEEEDADYIDPQTIDAYWLQRNIKDKCAIDDDNDAVKMSDEVMQILRSKDERDVENRLVILLDYDKFDFIKVLLRNRYAIDFCSRLLQAQDDAEKATIQAEMRAAPEGQAILEALEHTHKTEGERKRDMERRLRKELKGLKSKDGGDAAAADAGAPSAMEVDPKSVPRQVLDLDSLAFAAGGHLMANKRCELPEGSQRVSHKGYEEVYVPGTRAMDTDETLTKVADLPEWARPAFAGTESLNRIQTKVHETCLFGSENMLVCAPTGAGKTNVALLTMLHEIGLHRKEDGTIDLQGFKIVYLAPMKALVAEIVLNFGKRLESYGITVKEFTGDVQLNKEQLAETQVIVMTPEKFDVITRKGDARPFTQLIKLVIIDEVHLLHDNRGAVLEALVARTIRQIETTQEMVRLVGLSATLPNYKDVAAFMRVDPDKGLFFFDSSFRPVPLEQQYIGITEKKALKRFQLMNEIVYEKTVEQAGRNQVLVFVHSRKETAKTARAIRAMAEDKDTLGKFMQEDSASQEICKEMAETVKNQDLKELLPFGMAIHHAGMVRSDRELVESLFADGHVQVLVSTATLAWGVNLPAHTVIIKGTQVYSPEEGKWVELSSMDVMQMMGRAGRPQYDTTGVGIIITTYTELQYYLSLLNEQLPIESQMVKCLPDLLNAEIVLGSVLNMRDAVNWLGYSYLYIRMLRNPTLYSVTADDEDKVLEQHRTDLIHTTASALAKANLIKYDRKTGNFQSTDLGRVASYYYVTHNTMGIFNEHLKPTVSDIELLRIFSMAGEFRNLAVREEEKMELHKLADRVPIPIKEGIEEPTAKVNVLLQAYISQLKLEGFALMADMTYITQSAGRLMRALYEIVLRRGWASLTLRTLGLCKMVDKRMWGSMIPLRQFTQIPIEIIKKLEKKDVLSWERFFDMSPQEIGELIRFPKMGKTVHKLIHQFPKLELAASVQPITRNVLKVELTITPDFQWDNKVHGASELFQILVEDVDGETILHNELFILKGRFIEEEHTVAFTVNMHEPMPPQYFIKVVSDRWLGSQTVIPVSFRHLILPEKFPARTELLDLQPLPVSALRNPSFERLYPNFTTFNAIQTQVHNTLYNTSDNTLLAAPAGSGKTVCAEFAMLRMFTERPDGRCVYITPFNETVEYRLADWTKRFASVSDKVRVAALTGETSADLKILEKSNVVISTPVHWDILSRRWKQRKNVQGVALFIVDEMHLVGGEMGPIIEVVTSRMRYIASQTDNKTRIVALSTSVANAKDIGDWIGASSHSLYNFHPNVRPIPLEIHIQGTDIPHYASRMLAMSKPMYSAVTNHSPAKPVLIYTADRKHCRITAFDIVAYASVEESPDRFLHCSKDDIEPYTSKLKDKTLREAVMGGVGMVHEGMVQSDRDLVLHLYKSNAIQVLVVAKSAAWSVSASAHLVVIMGTESYDGKEHRYVQYPITDVLQMMGRAGRYGEDAVGKAVILCHTPNKEIYKKFLHEPVPVESHLDHFLHDHMSAEIVTKVVENKQEAVDWLTWTFFYRRLTQNPNYYNMTGTTHRHMSDHLSELVETVVKDLEQSKTISVEDDDNDLSALNLGMIAAYYYIRYTTIELFNSSLKEKTKIKGIIEILSNASEYANLPMRHGEEKSLRQLAAHVPITTSSMKYTDPHTKAFLLLQAHFSRLNLAGDLTLDQKTVLHDTIRLVQAMVDVISSSGWLKPALAAMEVAQMTVQGLWDSSSNLMQLPHFTKELCDKCAEAEVETVFDLMDMEDADRNKLLNLSDAKMGQIASVCNKYPNVTLEYEVVDKDEVGAGEQVQLVVKLERENEGEVGGAVHAPHYPKDKEEGWWIVVGDPATNTLASIKRVNLQRKATVKLDFTAPEEVGQAKFTLFFMCDSWAGCDQEYEFELDVKEAADDDDEDDE
mmetsp:Transcript_34715/g.87733  ORF Transcript_34715/g.87733 Transcript_34715/m.87733 type:complete len:2149 (+) Transcript_34715:158-6604(+)|eukprot:CAMPEP_0173431928 /NCGR_PEP_ID=MMETSP1357-20121228/9900_1 /TAXON_ID=77926 /ORGANISM="Hemiselmis rufescens, Strain PCC563" /LENGTH=2148 /DNA_ID=CAMNT_0014396459 /DNA_START=148 /DNA_END=6594 /DNA_ORIENTATION=+